VATAHHYLLHQYPVFFDADYPGSKSLIESVTTTGGSSISDQSDFPKPIWLGSFSSTALLSRSDLVDRYFLPDIESDHTCNAGIIEGAYGADANSKGCALQVDAFTH
jgi:hypothetical protein